ncbi:uncharacterized protein YaeQ [Variovorax paradoxus]|nr:uncharacterized protein YaeQ [Variovorax paradoxus]
MVGPIFHSRELFALGGYPMSVSERKRPTRPQNLQVYRVPTEASQALAALAQRSMQLQATIQENTLTLGDGTHSIDVELLRWK